MPAVLISNDDIRDRILNRPQGSGAWQEQTPAWLEEIVRTSDWHLLERWSEDVGSQFGDYADGQATVSLYGIGDDRIQIHTYPQWSDDFDGRELSVCQMIEGWTVELDDDGNDHGVHSADINYNHGETFYSTLDACQAEADRWGQQDDSWWMRGSTLYDLMRVR